MFDVNIFILFMLSPKSFPLYLPGLSRSLSPYKPSLSAQSIPSEYDPPV